MSDERKLLDKRLLRNLQRRVNRVRNFPTDTCPASRHLHIMADTLTRYGRYPMFEEEPIHCAISILAVLESLWKLRAATRPPDATGGKHDRR